jgi:uncharacterized protein (DUF305 family)
MTTSRRAFMGAAAAFAPFAAYAQHHHAGAAQSTFGGEMHERMAAMVAAMEAAPMTGDPDRDFLAMMIPHHQGALEMARLVLLHGRDPLTRQLAEAIIASQQAEIASMQARLHVLSTGGASQDHEFPALSGTWGQ